MPLRSAEIRLDTDVYRLARKALAEKVQGASARRWEAKRIPVTTKRDPPSNVKRGEIPGEWIITYDDWSKGLTGDHQPLPGTILIASNVDVTKPGSMASVAAALVKLNTGATDSGGQSCRVLLFNSQIFAVVGRYTMVLSGDSWSADKDFGAGVYATDAIVWNNELVVGFGGSTTKIWTRDTSGVWTQATDAVYANYFAIVEDRLWRATATNEVSNIAGAADPMTLANWSSGIPIGDDGIDITQLNGYGERLAVSKQDGLYLGDAAAIFPNVLPHIASMSHINNGRYTLVRGADIFYPYANGGLIRYSDQEADEVGIRECSTTVDNRDIFNISQAIYPLCAEGEYLWATASVEPGKDIPTGFLKTTDNENTFTGYKSEVTDNSISTYADLSSLDTAANGDYFYIGYSAVFYGAHLVLSRVDTNNRTLTAQYWTGAAWASIPADTNSVPVTVYNGVLTASQHIYWRVAPSDWATKSINGTSAYWIRFSASGALSAAVYITNCRVDTSAPRQYILRGRLRRAGDVRPQSIIWEPIFDTGAGYDVIRAMMMSGNTLYAATRNYTLLFKYRHTVADYPIQAVAGQVIMYKDDAGMPEVNKAWIDVTIKGKQVDASHTYDWYFRVDENLIWIGGASNVTTSPSTTTLTSLTGRAFQMYVNLDAPTADYQTEINNIEVRFRELPTYKMGFKCLLELADNQSGSQSGMLPTAAKQFANLCADHGAGSKTLIAPEGTAYTVTVEEVEVVEYLQEGLEYPTLLVQLTMMEV